jgi:hypothetical protein
MRRNMGRWPRPRTARLISLPPHPLLLTKMPSTITTSAASTLRTCGSREERAPGVSGATRFPRRRGMGRPPAGR